MTSSGQPEDTSVRLDDIDSRLEELGDQLDLIRTIQDANRRETRGNSQTVARLERSIRELGDIARLHQESLRIAQREAERDRLEFRQAQQEWREEIRRIWEYLRDRNGGSSTPN